MNLSKKANSISPSITLEITGKANELKAQGVNVMSFAAGEPDFNTPKNIIEAAIKAMDDGYTKYTKTSGIVELRKAICKKLHQENNLNYSEEQIVVSTGAKQCLANTFLAILNPGDEVIVPAYTYTASASVVAHVGATIVMVDAQSECVEMDYNKLADAITEKTKVIVPVDLAGICVNLDKIYEVINSPEIKAKFTPSNDIQRKIGRIIVSNDCAHSFGANRHGKMAGEIADFSSFSFHAVKNFTTAEGGTWNLPFGQEKVERQQVYCGSPVPFIEGETWNEFLYRLSQLFSLHGQNKDALAKTKFGAWEYDIIGPWYKCNMTDIMAAMGLIQFERYPTMLKRRRAIIEKMDVAFADLNVTTLKHYGDDWEGSGHLYMVRLSGHSRKEVNIVIEKMAERGIATNVHYKPLPMMTAYKALGFDIVNFPNAYHLFENEITLPLNTRMTDEDVDYVIENFVEIVKSL